MKYKNHWKDLLDGKLKNYLKTKYKFFYLHDILLQSDSCLLGIFRFLLMKIERLYIEYHHITYLLFTFMGRNHIDKNLRKFYFIMLNILLQCCHINRKLKNTMVDQNYMSLP
jgi:hypothetical protein